MSWAARCAAKPHALRAAVGEHRGVAVDADLALAAHTLDRVAVGVLRLSTDGTIAFANRYICDYLGYTVDELVGRTVFDINPTLHPDTWPLHSRRFMNATPKAFETVHRRKSGATIPVEVQVAYLEVDGRGWFVATSRDLSQEKLAESERASLEAQLAHARRLEAVGQLAGGVAHDFNNMLGVMMLAAEHGLHAVSPDAPVRADLDEILQACTRSAELTRQLLTFARRQTIAPRVLDLAAAVDGALKLLRRSVGADIELRLTTAPGLWPVRLDPVQVEQIVSNLVLNARDAIDGAGVITLALDNVTVSNEQPSRHGVSNGDHVRLTVHDSGRGMTPDLLTRIFEPFFTTKQLGRGTGLGLATVFGIVGQNRGAIRVESAPGDGTTFTLYFPPADQPKDPVALAPVHGEPHGTETLLVVDDEPRVLHLTCGVLETLGYRVLAAAGADEALALLAEHRDDIQLLLTDIVMPGMTGTELARRVTAIAPQVAVLYVSGHAADAATELGPSTHFVQKPVSRHGLAHAVRRALDLGTGSTPPSHRNHDAFGAGRDEIRGQDPGS